MQESGRAYIEAVNCEKPLPRSEGIQCIQKTSAILRMRTQRQMLFDVQPMICHVSAFFQSSFCFAFFVCLSLFACGPSSSGLLLRAQKQLAVQPTTGLYLWRDGHRGITYWRPPTSRWSSFFCGMRVKSASCEPASGMVGLIVAASNLHPARHPPRDPAW